jgi:hypothetical protein
MSTVLQNRNLKQNLPHTFPTIIVIFVPAGMTGLFQPCDVGFQHILKLSLKKSGHEDVVQEVLQELQNGKSAQEISVNTKVRVLRDRTVHWMWTAFSTLNKRHIIQKV